MKKKSLWLIGIFFVVGLSLTLVVSADNSCEIVARSQCDNGNGEYIAFGINGLTSSGDNGHVQTKYASQTYDFDSETWLTTEWSDTQKSSHVLCCNFETGYTEQDEPAICDETGTNRIIAAYPWESNGLGVRDAHAEVPFKNKVTKENVYGWNVCYDALVCKYQDKNNPDPDFNPSDFDVNMDLSLSQQSNAHVGKKDVYDYQVYCALREVSGETCSEVGGEICGAGYHCELQEGGLSGLIVTSDSNVCCITECVEDKRAYWSPDADGADAIDRVELNTPVYMALEANAKAIGTQITFNVYEVGGDGTVIKTATASVDEYQNTLGVTLRKAIASWTPMDSELDNIGNWENENINSTLLYFRADDQTSNELNVTKPAGDSGSTPTRCSEYTTNETCIANSEEINLGVLVDWYEYDDLCYRRNNGTGCGWNNQTNTCITTTAYQYPPVADFNQTNPEVCEEVQVSCQYEETESGSCASGDEFIRIEYTLITDDAQCDADVPSRTVPCADVELIPFFDKMQFVISIIVLGLIYGFIILRKRE